METTQEKIFQEFKNKFGVQIVADKDHLDIVIEYNRADEKRVNEYVESFLFEELSIYSSKVLKKSKLSRIVLCKNLAFLGSKQAAIADVKSPDLAWLSGNQICIDVEYPLSTYARQVVHHELYHLIDCVDRLDGTFDSEWEKLNQPGFKYNDYGPLSLQPSAVQGFISPYATSRVCEDKAETYAHMILNYKGIEKLAQNDLVLKSKMRRMKELMEAFSDEFNEEFWQERVKASTPYPF